MVAVRSWSGGERRPRVLVTGGASGIGAAIAGRFVGDGASVGILDRDDEALHRMRATGMGVDLLLHADVADAASVAAAFAAVDRDWGGVDVLCNNAGISIRESFLETTLA